MWEKVSKREYVRQRKESKVPQQDSNLKSSHALLPTQSIHHRGTFQEDLETTIYAGPRGPIDTPALTSRPRHGCTSIEKGGVELTGLDQEVAQLRRNGTNLGETGHGVELKVRR